MESTYNRFKLPGFIIICNHHLLNFALNFNINFDKFFLNVGLLQSLLLHKHLHKISLMGTSILDNYCPFYDLLFVGKLLKRWLDSSYKESWGKMIIGTHFSWITVQHGHRLSMIFGGADMGMVHPSLCFLISHHFSLLLTMASFCTSWGPGSGRHYCIL